MSDLVPAGDGGALSKDEMNWGMYAHLSTFCGYVVPFGNVLGPLVIWQLKKDEMPFAADQAKEALNFQITVTIGILVSVLLSCFLIGYLTLILIPIADLILTVLAAIEANKGVRYRYPATLRLIT